MKTFCTLNKRIIEAVHKRQDYAVMITDLVNLHVITVEEAESILGYKIPNYVCPNPLHKSSGNDDSGNDDSGNDDSGNDDSQETNG